MLFCDGNLSSVEIEKCVKIIIETKVLNHVRNDKKVKFGYSRNGNFQKRMSDYDYDKKIKYEKTSNIDEYILITSGEFIEFGNKSFLLTPNDIRKFELMFISQFWFLDYKRFSHLLLNNNGGGGDIGITKKENDSVNEKGEITREDSLIYLRVAQSGSTEDVRKMMKDIKIVD
ncbi:hypothetical protein PVAND_016678 [Polypedilum vanderplanki]|uniref:Uncharacterized protein n=1 Tax=Polypedilum vanderplanki TaxID=319348 RepID=A0A9J6BGN4_POLVA|nr:hypothetical protein PVAND_016678 [Polypedilum vanderplanki]